MTFPLIGRINLEFIRSLQLALPNSDEQKEIVRVLDMHGEGCDSEEAKVSKLHSLKRGLAHDLLTGRVRVRLPSSLQTTKGLARLQGV